MATAQAGPSRPGTLDQGARPRFSRPKSFQIAGFLPTKRLDRDGPVVVLRARTASDRGPGCYVLKAVLGAVAPAWRVSAEVAKAQLWREAEVAQQVAHPNLQTVLDAHLDVPCPYLVLPYREGGNLQQLLAWHRRQRLAAPPGLPLPWILGVLRQVAAALAALHGAGWLHGQVWAEHILVHPGGHACLIDVTAARQLQTAECVVPGGLPPGARYAAPEWSVARGRLTEAADVYALGCVLWECLAGQPPFAASTVAELVRQHRLVALPDLRQLRPDIPWDLAAAVRQMLAKEPLRRPSAGQVERWLAEMAVEALAAGG